MTSHCIMYFKTTLLIIWKNVEQNCKGHTYVNLQIPICSMLVQLSEIYNGYCKRNPYSTKKSLCTVMSEV